MTEEHIEFVKGIATVMAAANSEVQFVFLTELARGMDKPKLEALLVDVINFADEDESKALCQLARAINERDEVVDRNEHDRTGND